MSGPQRYFALGPLPGAQHTRYAVLHGDHTVTEVVISRPDGEEQPKPAHIRWRRSNLAKQLAGVQIKTWRINETPVNPAAGEQPRRPTWKRAGHRAQGVA